MTREITSLGDIDPEEHTILEIAEAFDRVKVGEVRQWIDENPQQFARIIDHCYLKIDRLESQIDGLAEFGE